MLPSVSAIVMRETMTWPKCGEYTWGSSGWQENMVYANCLEGDYSPYAMASRGLILHCQAVRKRRSWDRHYIEERAKGLCEDLGIKV
jgi:hypothetical protein